MAKVAKKAARQTDVRDVLKQLERAGSAKFRADMGPRYGIIVTKAWGAPMGAIKAIAKPLGRDHKLAQQLWASGWYDARLLASMVGDPEVLSSAEMDRWCKDFDNWGVVDTLCFNLFDRSPHAWAKIDKWAVRKAEFEKRAAFALLATMALHKRGEDADLLKRLPLIEAAATDERNFVKKGVSWALRAMARRGPKVRAAATLVARRLAATEDATARWVGRDGLRDLAKK